MVYEGNWSQTQQGTYLQNGIPSTPPASFGGGGGGFNWGAFASSAAQGIGAGLSAVDGTNAYKGVGAAITAGSENLQKDVGARRNLGYLEDASEIETKTYEEKLMEDLKAEREEYNDQLDRIREADEGSRFLQDMKPGNTVNKAKGIMQGLSGFRAGDRTETRRQPPPPGVPETKQQRGLRMVEHSRGFQA